MERTCIAFGALAGLLAVALAAVAAHLPLDPQRLVMLRDAVQMQGWHALALVGTGLWLGRVGLGRGRVQAVLAGFAFMLGLVLFCGAVDLLVFAGHSLGMVAPAGGMLLMLGWLLLGISALRAR